MTRVPIDDDDEGQEQALEGEPNLQGGDDVARLQAERDELFDRLARTTADFQNSRKRLQAESDQRAQYANANLIKSLLPVIDNFERALAVDAAKSDPKSILKGMQMIHDQWLAVLRQQQVEEISPEPGDAFDPTKHEAIMQQPSDKYEAGSVVQTLQKGYALHDRTLRPAQVAVSKMN